MKNNILISIYIIAATLSTFSFANNEDNLEYSINQKHAVTGK